MKHAILILTMIAFPFVRAAEGDALTQLSLGEIEIQALENSYSKKALNAEYDSVKTRLIPKTLFVIQRSLLRVTINP